MTLLESIKAVGDILTELDVLMGSLLPSDARQRDLRDLRLLLDDRQRELARQIFDENSVKFQQAAEELQAVNNQIRGSIRQIDKLNQTIQNVTRFLNAVTGLLATTGTFA
jgi:acyl-CoA reductase-like NAD-dependent aldehyde dehydrogenase